jgi:Ca2+-binding RTX toxin-like protein
MAVVRIYSTFSFLQAQDWDFTVASNSATELTIQNTALSLRQVFRGTGFTYDSLGNVDGTVTSTTFLKNGARVYEASGLSHDAATLQAYAEATGDTQAMYAFVLAGNDSIVGSAGNDTILGYGGSDTINGGLGADVMLGGGGNDTYTYDNASDVVLETTTRTSGVDAGGVDTVRSSIGYTLGNFVEKLSLTGTSNIGGTGNALGNTLIGNAGANRLSGLAGNDYLYGGAGNDVLAGGSGRDRLIGQAGNDTFDYNALADSGITSSTWDVITDFTRGQDRIDLSGIDANAATASINDRFTFIGTAAFTGNATGQARVVSDAVNNTVTVFVSTDADTAPELAIRLNGLSTLSSADFVL